MAALCGLASSGKSEDQATTSRRIDEIAGFAYFAERIARTI
jgi:hypothetical protein